MDKGQAAGQVPAHQPDIREILHRVLEKGADDTLQHYGRETILKAMEESRRDLDAERGIFGPTPWSPDYSNLRKCNNVDDVKAVIAEARAAKKAVRIAGAQHSSPPAIFAGAEQPSIHVKLEADLRSMTVVEENKEEGYIIIRAGAGCNLGIDPSDDQSTAENSFNRQVDKLGYALPILGGMSHQTLGGFMMTSTAGGSLAYGFADVVESFELVDGLGDVRTLTKGTDDFYAAAVSMGLFGVITHVTVKLRKNYLVSGYEETVATKDSILATADTLAAAFKDHTYVHSVWFPSKGVDRVLQFIGEQAPETAPIEPYHHILQQQWMNYAAATALYLVNELDNASEEALQELADFIVRVVNPIGPRRDFCDHWYLALPNDDQALIDTVIRVQFTEIWIDVARIPETMSALQDLFERDPLAAGNFGVEIYCAKASDFWMSQSYGRDVVRVDPYWWEYNPKGNLQDFFTKYWNVLLTIPTARLHWGKHFPAVGTKFGNITMGPDYVARAFPKFGEWMALRARYDPEQIFVTSYWRGMLGIPQPSRHGAS
ncbi:D-arabinono-1,4-lactone oxidase [Sorangium sp. So ce269]